MAVGLRALHALTRRSRARAADVLLTPVIQAMRNRRLRLSRDPAVLAPLVTAVWRRSITAAG